MALFLFLSEAVYFLSLTAVKLQRAELHKNLPTKISTVFSVHIFFFWYKNQKEGRKQTLRCSKFFIRM